jgi:drug/metabolite transporter (DMT)-like permease
MTCMKKHLLSLFDPSQRWRTISFFLASALLIIVSQMVGITDNLPGIALLLSGMICLFYALLHPWRKSKNYAILSGVLFGLILLTFLVIFILSTVHKTEYLSEAIVMGFIGLICIPGIVAGIIGILFWSNRAK